MRWLPLLITIVELRSFSCNDLLAWCDTIECTLLYIPKDHAGTPGKKANKFLYIPSDDILKRLGNGSVETFQKAHYSDYESNFMKTGPDVDHVQSYTYIPELGRFQDIILVPPSANVDNTPIINVLDYMKNYTLYTIYSNVSASDNFCRDQYGFSANAINNSETCMSIHKVIGGTAERYSGPLTFNRIKFEEDDYLLRFLLSNMIVSSGNMSSKTFKDTMETFNTCRHKTDAKDEDNKCYSVLSMFGYASICCCYTQKCKSINMFGTRQYRQIGYGSQYDSNGTGLHVNEYPFDVFANASIGEYCAIEMRVSINNETVNKKATLDLTLEAGNATGSWLDYLVVHHVTCYPVEIVCPNTNIPDRFTLFYGRNGLWAE
ncbi:unnamed protein product [Bursaphelenchus okinawaensis]|uniref:Uncharacterized protein n=1 Tax=Bursaphelenchus okinawaensis TaxID=465554 RepID=A0A811JUZ2_9BILA|nr:unnamed protein product [Bursaphelenchus okinawaensis]CAG9083653.1 unnamed protein product [Bursaphelenchus okinawaensis]